MNLRSKDKAIIRLQPIQNDLPRMNYFIPNKCWRLAWTSEVFVMWYQSMIHTER